MDFGSRIVKMSQNYNGIRLSFDRYIHYILVEKLNWKKPTSGNEIRCHIVDDTNIANISLKQLLPQVTTQFIC